MSIMRCTIHDRSWDSDFLEECPECVTQEEDGYYCGGCKGYIDEDDFKHGVCLQCEERGVPIIKNGNLRVKKICL